MTDFCKSELEAMGFTIDEKGRHGATGHITIDGEGSTGFNVSIYYMCGAWRTRQHSFFFVNNQVISFDSDNVYKTEEELLEGIKRSYRKESFEK